MQQQMKLQRDYYLYFLLEIYFGCMQHPSSGKLFFLHTKRISLLPILLLLLFSMYRSSVDPKINSCSNFIDDTVLYLPKEIFILKKIVITTLVTCIRYVFSLFPYNFFNNNNYIRNNVYDLLTTD